MAENAYQQTARIFDFGSKKGQSTDLKMGDGDGTSEDMDKERLARLEGGFDGLRSNQAILMTAIAFVSAALLGIGSYTLIQINALNSHFSGVETRITGLEGRVNELPGRISAELRDINRTLSDAITASKQTPPQVILLPTPAPAPPVPAPKPN